MAADIAESGWEVDVVAAARAGVDRPYEFVRGVRVIPVEVPTWFENTLEAVGRLRRRGLGKDQTSVAMKSDGARAFPVGLAKASRPDSATRRIYTGLMTNLNATSRFSAELGWARRAVHAGLAGSRSRPPTLVAVTSPPHPAQVAGARIARALGVPFLADFRDPWLFGEQDTAHSTAIDARVGGWAQRQTFASVDLAVFNTRWAMNAAVAYDPSLAKRSATVSNGYDPRPEVSIPDTDYFRVAFVGWLYDFMDPGPLLAACARLKARTATDAIRVEFVGTDIAPGGVSLMAQAQALGLEQAFEHRQRLPRQEALRTQERAAVQVVFDYPGPFRVPMKFYDATQNYGDLLLIGRSSSALADAAARVGCTVCAPDDPAAIDAVLDQAFNRWLKRDYRSPIDGARIFARGNTSLQMLDLLERLAK